MIYESCLNNMSDDVKQITSVILKNTHGKFEKHDLYKELMSVTIKIIEDFIPLQLVSVQPMDNHSGYFKYLKEGIEQTSSKVHAITSRCRTVFEKDNLNRTADELHNEITREICTDLRNNAGTRARTSMTKEAIILKLEELDRVIYQKTGNCNNCWLVASPETAKELIPDFAIGTRIKSIGQIDRWNVIVDPLFPKNEILIGRQDELLDGYIYMPYMMIFELWTIPEPDTLDFKQSICRRYKKYLLPNGMRHYGTLRFLEN